MIIGLISDTHILDAEEQLSPRIKEVFCGVDLILYAGDIYVLSLLDQLETLAPIVAARGNGDMWLPEDPRLRVSHVLSVEGLRIGLTHSLDYPEPSWRTFETAMQTEFGGPVDVLVFGDSHVEMLESYKSVLLVNPGSPTLPHQIKKLGTVAILQINQGQAKAHIIQL